jgi:hypothetical protein
MKLLIPCGNDQHFVSVHTIHYALDCIAGYSAQQADRKHTSILHQVQVRTAFVDVQDFHLQILIKNLYILLVENKETHRLFCAQYTFFRKYGESYEN